MKDVLESLIVLMGYVVALVFVGWVFYETRSGWSFALLLILPFINRKGESDGN